MKKKKLYLFATCVFPMKDFDLTYTLTVNCSSRLFSVFFLWNMKREWRIDRCFWNLTIAVQNSAFWILNEMMNRFAQASAEAGFALRNMGSERQSFVVVCGRRLWILLLSVEILFVLASVVIEVRWWRIDFGYFQLISRWEGGVNKIKKSKRIGVESELKRGKK